MYVTKDVPERGRKLRVCRHLSKDVPDAGKKQRVCRHMSEDAPGGVSPGQAPGSLRVKIQPAEHEHGHGGVRTGSPTLKSGEIPELVTTLRAIKGG